MAPFHFAEVHEHVGAGGIAHGVYVRAGSACVVHDDVAALWIHVYACFEETEAIHVRDAAHGEQCLLNAHGLGAAVGVGEVVLHFAVHSSDAFQF